MNTDTSSTPVNASASQAEPSLSPLTIFLGLFPIVLMSLVTIPAGTQISFLLGGWANFIIFYALVLIVAGIAWYRGSPRWSYSYTGFLLVFTWYLTSLPAPTFTLAGFHFPPHGELWGSWIWIPLLATVFVVLIAKRSWKPLQQFLQNVRFDWTLYTFLLYSAMPWLSWALFDEIRNKPLVVISLLVADLSLLFGAWFYLRSRTIRRRALSLFYGMLPAVLITVIATSAYWHGRQESWMLSPGNGYADALREGLFFIIILFILFFPGLASRVKHKLWNWRSA